MFEVVHTLTDWYDGPRRGIANYHGQPHLFESEWGDGEYLDADTFLLMPIDPDIFSLALEDWAIWRRWETAFHQGKAAHDTHPALPGDRRRHEELERLLQGRLVVDPARAVRKMAAFQVRSDPEWSGYGWRPLEVRWEDPSRPWPCSHGFENDRSPTANSTSAPWEQFFYDEIDGRRSKRVLVKVIGE